MPTVETGEFFRANVGAMIIDESGRILALRRADVDGEAWQLPQGGISPDEEPREALVREIREETGLTERDYAVVMGCEEWIAYELPREYRSEKVGRGQVQKWFLCRLTGDARRITPDQIEFDAWKWVGAAELLRDCVAFRVPVYQRLVKEFGSYLGIADR